MTDNKLTALEQDAPDITLNLPKKRKGRPKGAKNNIETPKEPGITKPTKSYPSLEDLENMPLQKYEDYLAYNDAVRLRRKYTRKKDVPFLYAPEDLVPMRKVRITRTSNRGKPIHINIRKTKYAVWFKSPPKGYADGEEIMMPECMIEEINKLAEAKYKQVKYPDGSHETVLDYWDNKYSVQTIH